MRELQRCLASNLKTFRLRWGYSQADLAERSEISVSYVGEIEVGVKWPSAETLEKLAGAFHLKPYQLFLDPADALDFQAWLERRDQISEVGEKILAYFENRRP